eukprot:TRINITY_DN64590_c0_g1_i1.p2 TRINITY_DN64590_c0_g1~~TRINITY_DN64590_c0_g1_i1.p2  ORF type:complete len:137 (-),score=33.19 TRINITY_DN64590_c0_g1_i1:201-611(-)
MVGAMKAGTTPLPAPQPVPPGIVINKAPPKPLLLFVTNVKNARTAWVEISINDNVDMLKKYVARKMGIPVVDMILIYGGEELKNELKIKDSRLEKVIQKVAAGVPPCAEESTIHLINIKDTPVEIREPAEPEPAAS